MNEPDDDRQLMQFIVQKDAGALETLYDRYERLIYSFAFRIVKDSMAAEEVVQELFLRIWNNAERFDSSQGKLSTWMFSITRNIAIDHLRRKSSRAPQVSTVPEQLELVRDESIATEDAVEQRMLGEEVRTALEGLSEEQQQVLEMIYYQGYTQQEVAERAAIPLGTVKSRVRLAMRQLQQRLVHLERVVSVHD